MFDEVQLAETFAESQSKSIRVRFKPQSYTPLPSDKYNLRLTDIIESCGAFDQPIYVFRFEVVDGQYRGSVINGLINKNVTGYGVKSKLWKWVLALSGIEIDAYDDFDLMKLVGKECRAVIKRMGHINNVSEILPKNVGKE